MTKTEFTKTIIEEVKLTITFEEAYDNWLYNDINDVTLRLTNSGYYTLKALHEFYKFPIKLVLNGKFYSTVKKIQCAYYIDLKNSTIYISSSKIAMLIKLYGSTEKYLESFTKSNT